MTTITEDILSPELRAVIERCAAEHKRDRPNRWKNYERVKSWIFFNTKTAEAQAAAIKLYVDLAKL